MFYYIASLTVEGYNSQEYMREKSNFVISLWQNDSLKWKIQNCLIVHEQAKEEINQKQIRPVPIVSPCMER